MTFSLFHSSNKICLACTLLVLDSKAFSKYRLLMASRSIIMFTVTKQNICFPPQFSGVYLQASALTALLRWRFNSAHTWRRHFSVAGTACQIHTRMQNIDVQKVHQFALMRKKCACTHTDTGGHINRPSSFAAICQLWKPQGSYVQ